MLECGGREFEQQPFVTRPLNDVDERERAKALVSDELNAVGNRRVCRPQLFESLPDLVAAIVLLRTGLGLGEPMAAGGRDGSLGIPRKLRLENRGNPTCFILAKHRSESTPARSRLVERPCRAPPSCLLFWFMPSVSFPFDNTFAAELEGLYVDWKPEGFPSPSLVVLNHGLLAELGLDEAAVKADAAGIFSGNRVPEGSSPLAQVYAGHQFGNFAPQLGDGRALLLGELVDANGARRDLQLKGSGRTPFSRGGDGRATLGPVLREYLMGEAMHRLGIPTTRAVAAVTTGEKVRRTELLPGAVLGRVAASHLRVGTFEFFAAKRDTDKLRRLTDYAISRHYPEHFDAENTAYELLREVAIAQATLIAKWMHVGFIHGVMNTDNATISGETIDYGPCAFMDTYDPATVFSSIDRATSASGVP